MTNLYTFNNENPMAAVLLSGAVRWVKRWNWN